MFLGTFEHNLDAKNRLTIPSKVLNTLDGNMLVVSKGFDGCLEARSPSDFKIFVDKLMALSQNKLTTRTILRQLLANAAEIEIDSANRILIPNNLLKEVGITKEVTIIGLGNKLEIWDSNQYSKFKENSDGILEKIAEDLDDNGI